MRHKRVILLLLSSWIMLPLSAHADWDLSDIITLLSKIHGLQEANMPKLNNLDDINRYTQQQLAALTGKHSYAKDDYVDYHTWGNTADNWDSALNGYTTGSGDFARMAQKLHADKAAGFIINPDIKTVNPKATQEKYHLLQAKTALASRAASQLAFDKIQAQITYHQQKLQPKIDNTNDVKSAIDLQNRLLFENNLIQLETLRMAALANQQQAVQSQSDVNQATINQSFASDLH